MTPLNPAIRLILTQSKLDVDASVLCLLAIHYKLDVNRLIPKEVIKGIQETRIVVKNPLTGATTWNVPLFEGQNVEWKWVEYWNNMFAKVNPERKDDLRAVTARMIEFFKAYPHYRVSDVRAATEAYLRTLIGQDPKFLKSSAKFIFEGKGKEKISHLAKWCAITASKEENSSDGMVGRMAG